MKKDNHIRYLVSPPWDDTLGTFAKIQMFDFILAIMLDAEYMVVLKDDASRRVHETRSEIPSCWEIW